MRRRILLAAILLAFISGCSTQIGAFTVLSTHNAEISRVDLKKLDLGRHTGESTRFWVLFIPFGREPSIDEAIDRALEGGKGDFMLNARLYDNSWTFLLFSWGSYVVRGEVGLSTKGGTREVVDACPPSPVPPPLVPPPQASPPR